VQAGVHQGRPEQTRLVRNDDAPGQADIQGTGWPDRSCPRVRRESPCRSG
jgi:hypothetical protein